MPISKEEFERLQPRRQVHGKSANELELKVSKWLDENNITYRFKEKIMASRPFQPSRPLKGGAIGGL